jgi:hypothetical protein
MSRFDSLASFDGSIEIIPVAGMIEDGGGDPIGATLGCGIHDDAVFEQTNTGFQATDTSAVRPPGTNTVGPPVSDSKTSVIAATATSGRVTTHKNLGEKRNHDQPTGKVPASRRDRQSR